MRFRAYFAVALLLSAAACSGGGASKGAGDADWSTYNHDLSSRRYSSLDEITTQNAGQLKRVCSVPLKETGSLQATPLVVGGTMYVTTSTMTYAIDAAKCTIAWTQAYTPKDKVPFPVNRGVAIDGDRIFRGEPDGHLVALGVKTGKVLWDVAPASGAKGEFLSAAPIVWNGTLYEGVAGSDWGVKGRMMAFDESSGKTLWTFTTIATGSDPNAKSWGNVRSAETGGGALWTSFTIDPDSGELFIPVANPAPDFASGYRPGANLYTDSIVALDAKTGAMKWYHQMVPHDVHDWDMSAAPVLYAGKDGRSMIAASGKDGYIYALDRSTHGEVWRTAGERIENFNTAPTIKGVHICPGVLGGSEWNGPAFDDKNHQLITPMDDWCATLKLGATRYIPGQFFFGGSYEGEPFSKARGTLTATDADTGKVRWQYHAGSPMLGGVTPTAGGVTFTGDMAGNFLVFDSSTGKVLFKDDTHGSIAGGVVTYLAGGKQYVAATSGNISRLTWGAQGRPSMVVYAL